MKRFLPYNQTVQQVKNSYKVSEDNGLNEHQVKSRIQVYGKNKLKDKKKINPFKLFISQFKSFIIYILLFAIVVAVIAKSFVDASVIFAILIVNATLGFIQEYRAEKGIAALKKLSALKAKVVRGGKTVMVDTEDLVPGDILVLEEGSKIPADARVIECISLQTFEASLTGESVPISKDSKSLHGQLTIAERKNMVFSGTIVTRGKAKAIVTATGMNSEIGKIAGMISDVKKDLTPLQKKLESLGKWLGLGTIVISLIIFITGVIKDGSVDLLFSGNILEFLIAAKSWLLTAVALAVAAVPEGLPAVVTLTLAIGVKRMLKKNALIRKLPSVETLGDTTVICCDKTGTLTQNEMTVRKAFVNGRTIEITGSGYDLSGELKAHPRVGNRDKLIFRIGALCSNAELDKSEKDVKAIGDPTEAALLVSAEKIGLPYEKIRKLWKRIKEEPFDSERKLMSTVNKDPQSGKSFVFTKGAPEKVLELCNRINVNGNLLALDKKSKNKILKKNDEYAKQALRVIGFAYKENRGELESNLIFVGLQGMIDPPHKEVKEAVSKCKAAGIRVVMVTGDNIHTAEGIAKEIGIEGQSMNGSNFAAMSKEEQIIAIKQTSILARVEPAHKMMIVELLQGRGEVVVMTGDGVNDAPAIKKADLGIAMGISGTDVTKETSDMVLLDDNFSSIVSAVEEGRGIKENIKKFVNYLLSSNLAEVFVILFALLLSWPLPMTAVMLLWLNLVTDGLPALALGVDPNPKNIMDQPPKKKSQILNRTMALRIVYMSVLITIGVLGLFYWGMNKYADLESVLMISKIQTLAFTALISMELVRLQAIRSEYKLGVFSNKYLVLAVISSIALQLAVIYTPLNLLFGTTMLNLSDWGMIIGVTAVVFVLNVVGLKLGDRFGKRKSISKTGKEV